MGLFWDKLKAMFKKNNDVELSEDLNEEFLNAIDNHAAAGGTMTFKVSKAPAQLVAVGFGPEYNSKLAHRKTKSQNRNWKRWKNRV